MAATELIFDITNSVFVQSLASPNQVPAPSFTAGDTRSLLVMLVARTSASVVAAVSLTGVTIKVGFGTPGYTPTLLTSATSSTVDSNGFLPLSLDFSVTAIQTALGTSSQITVTMEIKIIGATDPRRLALPCIINQRLLT